MHILHMIKRWARDEHGSITVEFVIWMPILAFWFVVSVAFYDAYKTRSDAGKAAHTITDLVSRQVDVNEAFFQELGLLAGRLLPRASEGLALRVTSVQYDAASDNHTVVWSVGQGGAQLMTNQEIPTDWLPDMAHLDTVILTELSAPYEPFTGWAGITADSWDFSIVSRPRFVTSIAKTD